MKTPEESARLYVSEEYYERLLKEIGPADSLVERVFLDGVKFGYEWAKRQARLSLNLSEKSKELSNHD